METPRNSSEIAQHALNRAAAIRRQNNVTGMTECDTNDNSRPSPSSIVNSNGVYGGVGVSNSLTEQFPLMGKLSPKSAKLSRKSMLRNSLIQTGHPQAANIDSLNNVANRLNVQRTDDEILSIFLRAQQQGIVGNQTPQLTNKNSFCNSSLTRNGVTRNSSNGSQWFVCRKCSQRAFTNHAEMFQHETLCIGMIDRQFHGSNMGVESLADLHQARNAGLLVVGNLPGNFVSNAGYGMSSVVPNNFNQLMGNNACLNQQMFHPNSVMNEAKKDLEDLQKIRALQLNQKQMIQQRALMIAAERVRNKHNESLDLVINTPTTLQNSSSQHNLTGPNKKEGENNTKKPCGKDTIEESFITLSRSFPLFMPSDKDWVTPLHCFVRRHCVEVFTASKDDVATPSKGKRKAIHIGQVGIRCPHCHGVESNINVDNKAKETAIINEVSTKETPKEEKKLKVRRERGSVYYPTTIASIYNATMNLLQRHLHSCSSITPEIMKRYSELKADDARSGSSKKYWVESSKSLGLIDTPLGIRISTRVPPSLPLLSTQQANSENSNNGTSSAIDDCFSNKSNALETDDIKSQNTEKSSLNSSGSNINEKEYDAASNTNKSNDNGGRILMNKSAANTASTSVVAPEDETTTTLFSYCLLSQMQSCVFTEADRLGKRKGLSKGFSGLACRHCYGGYGSGRFFPSSIKTMSDTSKTLNVLHSHMMRCRRCPSEIRATLDKLRATHDEERAKMKFGSQKAFFTKIWIRLHGKKPAIDVVANRCKQSGSKEPDNCISSLTDTKRKRMENSSIFAAATQALSDADAFVLGLSNPYFDQNVVSYSAKRMKAA